MPTKDVEVWLDDGGLCWARMSPPLAYLASPFPLALSSSFWCTPSRGRPPTAAVACPQGEGGLLQAVISAGESTGITITGKVPHTDHVTAGCRMGLIPCVFFAVLGRCIVAFAIGTPKCLLRGSGGRSHATLCPLCAVLPLRQHLPRLRQRKGCGLGHFGFG
jgi:hypothetical protein